MVQWRRLVACACIAFCVARTAGHMETVEISIAENPNKLSAAVEESNLVDDGSVPDSLTGEWVEEGNPTSRIFITQSKEQVQVKIAHCKEPNPDGSNCQADVGKATSTLLGKRIMLGYGREIQFKTTNTDGTHTVWAGKISPNCQNINWVIPAGAKPWKRVTPFTPHTTSVFIGEAKTILPCKHGLFMVNMYDNYISRSMFYYGEWGEDELQLLLGLLRPGSVVADVGAHIGTFAIPLAKKVGPTGFVFAFEPQHVLFQILASNAALNDLDNLFTYPIAISNTTGTLKMPRYQYNVESNFGAYKMNVDNEENIYYKNKDLAPYTVDAKPLDAVITEHCPDLLKIDVETMELAALQGASRILTMCRPNIFIENNFRNNSKTMIRMLVDNYQYTIYWVNVPYYSENNFRGFKHNVWPWSYSINMLCIPNERHEQTLAEQPAIKKLVKVRHEKEHYFIEDYFQDFIDMGLQTPFLLQGTE